MWWNNTPIVEFVVIAVIVLVLAGAGYWVMQRSSKNVDNVSNPGETVVAPTAPEIITAVDLQVVEQTLNSLNLEAGNTDNTTLDEQAAQLPD